MSVRVRFAPSPTGPLHIGGVRTALYNYLFAKKHNGVFILRIEDTDQTRFVPEAEAYIKESLEWLGLQPMEGPGYGGDFGPYKQSERKDLYTKFVQQLLDDGHAYYAFDTSEELDEMRNRYQAQGITAKYDHKTRTEMKNSLTMSEADVSTKLSNGDKYTVRLLVQADQTISFNDEIREHVSFSTNELDDKVLMKADGLPTYHLANVVDDYHMKISHVIRGEEWLSSTAHHVLMYQCFGWADVMPKFAHLPLILKPTGKGKLSKRDGAKFGMPVFPLSWAAENPEDAFTGFKEEGFLPDGLLNFLAFLGWNPGTEQEIFTMNELIDAFSIAKINKSGARFDFDKARWFGQQYLKEKEHDTLAKLMVPFAEALAYQKDHDYMTKLAGLMKERAHTIKEMVTEANYLFGDIKEYDEKTLRKKWKEPSPKIVTDIIAILNETNPFDKESIESSIKNYISENELGFGAVLPLLRIGLSGTMKGPDVFGIISLLGLEESNRRLSILRDEIASNIV